MTARSTWIAALLLLGCAVPAGATAPGGTTGTPAPATSPATARPRPAKGTAAPRPVAGTAAKPAAPAPGGAANAAARTLDDIHIEGEIPVPQVLFITTRDQRRFMGFQHRRYLRTSRKIGEDTAVPSRILVTGAATMPERSHSDE